MSFFRTPSLLPLHLTVALIVVTIAGAATAIAPDPNNITGSAGLILIDKLGHHIRFFDPATHKELSSLDAEANPHDVAVSRDRRTAYVPIYGDGVYGRNPHRDTASISSISLPAR